MTTFMDNLSVHEGWFTLRAVNKYCLSTALSYNPVVCCRLVSSVVISPCFALSEERWCKGKKSMHLILLVLSWPKSACVKSLTPLSAVPFKCWRATELAGQCTANGWTVHRKRYHVEEVQPLPTHRWPLRPGHWVHHERVPWPQDHQDQVGWMLVFF